jgi:hypothetical protein
VSRVQTWRLPVMLPPGTVAHALPVQYCTSKAVMPYALKVMLAVGSTGLMKASYRVKTSISVIVFRPLKAMWTESGKAFAVASFQPPPVPQLRPLRSPSLTAVTG